MNQSQNITAGLNYTLSSNKASYLFNNCVFSEQSTVKHFIIGLKNSMSPPAKQLVQPIVLDQVGTDVVVLLLPNGIRAEFSSTLSQTQIKYWVSALQ